MEQVYAIQTVQRNELKQLCKDIFSDIKDGNVDIQPELAEQPVIKMAYDLWYESKFEIYKGYADKLPEKMLLSQQQEFKSIKNMIISEVDHMEIDMTESIDITELSKGILGMFKAIENLFTN